jgi:calreticulin
MLYTILALAALCSAEIYFKETFDASWEDRWVTASGSGKVDVTAGDWYGDADLDAGLHTTQDAKFYHVSALHDEFSNKDKDLVIQFSVKHAQKIDCGGGYLKFLGSGVDQESFNGDTDYNIMFGPDICGGDKKVHVIFNYKDENHLITQTIAPETDELTHVYTLIVRPDQTYEVRIDGQKKKSGNLVDHWDFLPPQTIPDPEVSKPDDWVDEARIEDPEDEKPEGYDDIPQEIVDPDAEMPEDWDEEDDGEWEAPTISNPEYKGPWRPQMIDNPAYEGVWEHPHIDNPDYFTDDEIYAYTFGGVGLDVWQVKSGSIFDNIIITDDIEEAEAFLAETFENSKEDEKNMLQASKDAAAAAAEAAKAAEEEANDDDEWEEEDNEEEDNLHEDL